jgi:predicted phage tail protein
MEPDTQKPMTTKAPHASIYAAILFAVVVCAAVTTGALYYSAPQCEGDSATADANCNTSAQHPHDARFALLQHSSTAVSAAATSAMFAALFAVLLLTGVAAYIHKKRS